MEGVAAESVTDFPRTHRCSKRHTYELLGQVWNIRTATPGDIHNGLRLLVYENMAVDLVVVDALWRAGALAVPREKAGLAYYAYSSLNAGIGPGSLEVNAGVNPDNVEKATGLIVDELKRFIQDGVTEDELADIRNSLMEDLDLPIVPIVMDVPSPHYACYERRDSRIIKTLLKMVLQR